MTVERADALLEDWYDWSQQWRPKLGMPSLSPYCRELYSEADGREDREGSEESVYRMTMEAVDYCVESLPPATSRAIGLEMRQRRGLAREWKGGCNGVSYRKAMEALLPKLAARGLI